MPLLYAARHNTQGTDMKKLSSIISMLILAQAFVTISMADDSQNFNQGRVKETLVNSFDGDMVLDGSLISGADEINSNFIFSNDLVNIRVNRYDPKQDKHVLISVSCPSSIQLKSNLRVVQIDSRSVQLTNYYRDNGCSYTDSFMKSKSEYQEISYQFKYFKEGSEVNWF